MPTQYVDQRFPSFQEYIDRQSRVGVAGEDNTPRYAHPVDEWILRSLNATPVRFAIDKAIDTVVSYSFGQHLATAVLIDQRSFPELYDVLSHCAETLGISTPHAVTHEMGGFVNAFTAGTDDYAFISITAALCKLYSRDEASFVVGHECGHIAARHVTYHTLAAVLEQAVWLRSLSLGYVGWVLRMTAGLSLSAWSRRAEVTADRAGLLCCGDLHVAERALLRLVTGLADVENVDIDDYLRRSKEVQEYHGSSSWQQLGMSHPMIPKRIEGLRLFGRSDLYYELTEKERPAGETLLSREDLDRQVNAMVKP